MWIVKFSHKGGYNIYNQETGETKELNSELEIAEMWAESNNVHDGYIQTVDIHDANDTGSIII